MLKKLTIIKANPCAEGDSVASVLLSGATKEEVEKGKKKKRKKEIEVFDRITDELTSIYLNDFTFNEFPVHVEKTQCKADWKEKYLEKFTSFIHSLVSQALGDDFNM